MNVNWRKIGIGGLIGILVVVAVGGVGGTVWMHGQLRECREKLRQVEASAKSTTTVETKPENVYIANEGDDLVSISIAAGVSPAALMGLNGLKVGDEIKPGQKIRLPKDAQQPSPSTAETIKREQQQLVVKEKPAPEPVPEPKELKVAEFRYKDSDPDEEQVELEFSEPPDMTVLREYLSISPAPKSLSIEQHYWWSSSARERMPVVVIRGDFAFQTNLTLRLRAGCPAEKDAEAKPLAADFVRTFQRKDVPGSVRFVDSGRYLPPGGARMLAVDSINVSKVHCAAAAVPPANVVQLLARENGCYDEIADADSKSTENIADKFVEWKMETMGRRNEHQVSALKLRTLPDAASNGVFLVAIRSADRPLHDDWWWGRGNRNENWNPNRYRLVCVTDIGLTVRCEKQRLIVWSTSLMTGAPLTNCTVEVFGSNNRRLGVGRTDAKGLCTVDCSDRTEPFAVVAHTADGKDMSFMCLNENQKIENRFRAGGFRGSYVAPTDVTAFVWTERGIYRHDEPIFLHALVRNGRNQAPSPFPIKFQLKDPDGNVVAHRTVMTDSQGAAWHEGFRVPAELPSGHWQLEALTPGAKERVLGMTTVCVEEFAPPQIRVSVEPKGDNPTNFAFGVKAEHLYGGPARGLRSSASVVFEDVPFAPTNWPGWHFGNADLGLCPSYRRLWKCNLNDQGLAAYPAPLLEESGKPQAAVRATGEGVVFEAGGRPARARGSRVLHYYPFYVGTTLGGNVRIPDSGFARVKVACVKPDGQRLPEARKLKVKFERVESVYSCKENPRGWVNWTCDRVRVPQSTPVTELSTKAGEDVELEIPFRLDGDYVLTLTDAATDASFGATFWLGSRGDDSVRAPLADPSKITITADKALYRPGDVPRLLVKSPFAGWALLSVMRDRVLSTRVVKLAGATQEIELQPVEGSWAPNVDVSMSVVQSADNGGRHQTARAHGLTTLKVRRWENEFPVKVKTSYAVRAGEGGTLVADIEARGVAATGTVAVVTVVDEAIHMISLWKTPDPVMGLSTLRVGDLPLFDLFKNLLPVWDGDPTKVRGVKTGGDTGEGLLGRLSPVPTRRFKPLVQWQTSVPLTNGNGHVVFTLPEFVGEVRVTAVAYSSQATGAGCALQKVSPKLVLQPDAPRFAAPGDEFDVTLSLANRSGAVGKCAWKLALKGPVAFTGTGPQVGAGDETLAKDGSVTRRLRLKALDQVGEAKISFTATGFGESHVQTIDLPIRPAVASRESSGTVALKPGETRTFTVDANNSMPAATVRRFTANGSELAKLVGALEFLADYPHGCLEQTTSRIFPLITAGGILNLVAATGGVSRASSNRVAYVEAGVRRVESMIRANNFTMWPDCSYPPWDPEVSLYATHFLVAAEKAGTALVSTAKKQVETFLDRWSLDTNTVVSAYACHTLALAGKAPLDRMLMLYDRRGELDGLSRARLARAFALTGDRARAQKLIAPCTPVPTTVKEAAFELLALLELDPADPRIVPLVRHVEATRGEERYSWGTTEENAHALLALGAFYRHHPVKPGTPRLVLVEQGGEKPLVEKQFAVVRGADTVKVVNRGEGTAWLTWRQVELPRATTVTNEAHQIHIERTFRNPEGKEVDLKQIELGDLLIVDLALSTDLRCQLNDLVIQDLFPAAFEPVHGGLGNLYPWIDQKKMSEWVMRSDARDDRMLVFSKRCAFKPGEKVHFYYQVRVVSGGDFVLPGPMVEAMYAPDIHAIAAPARVVVAK